MHFAHAATIHTTMDDVRMDLCPQRTPKAVENVLGDAKNGYHENENFHRVMKKFASTLAALLTGKYKRAKV